jgi:hypothetical protein
MISEADALLQRFYSVMALALPQIRMGGQILTDSKIVDHFSLMLFHYLTELVNERARGGSLNQ